MAIARVLLVSIALTGCVKLPPETESTTPQIEPMVTAGTAVAQTTTVDGAGTISGVVTHRATKERLPSALVILQSAATTRETLTNDHGLYRFEGLPAATYTIQVLAGQADVSKVTTLPEAARFRANFTLDPDSDGIICRLPGLPRREPTASMFSISEHEGRLLGVPRTTIHR